MKRRMYESIAQGGLHEAIPGSGGKNGTDRWLDGIGSGTAFIDFDEDAGQLDTTCTQRQACTSGPEPGAFDRDGNGIKVAAPDWVWVTDITYLATDQGWLYLAGLKDLYSGELVGYVTG